MKIKQFFISILLVLLLVVNVSAYDKVELGPEYFPQSSISRAIAGAQIYVGVPDTDPSIAGNQKTLYVQQEDGTIVAVAQPIYTGAGGVPLYLGSPVTLLVNGDYSLKILNSAGSQIYYIPNRTWDTALAPGNYCYPNANATDQGVTGDSDTIKYCVDTIGTDEGTIFLRHGSGAATTTYTLSTDEVILANINLEIEKGAIISTDSGKSLTISSPANIIAVTNKQIFDGNGTVTFSSSGSGPVYPEWFGLDGTNDEVPFQKAVNAADATSYACVKADGAYLFHGTLYIGSSPITGNGTITIDSDATFSQLGAATRRTQGAILTKSSAGAGYGLSDVEISIKGISIKMDKSSDAGTSVTTALHLENVSKGEIESVYIYNETGNTGIINPLDAYLGVQNLKISKSRFVTNTGAASGGTWIRNYSTTSETKNIVISNSYFESSQGDEILAIFNVLTSSTVENIVVESTEFVRSGNVSYIISAYVRAGSTGILRNVRFSNISVYTSGNVTAGAVASWDSGGGGNIEGITIVNSNVRYKSDTSGGTVYGIGGFDQVIGCTVDNYTDTNAANSIYNYSANNLVTGCKSFFSGTTASAYIVSIYGSSVASDNPYLQGGLYSIYQAERNRIYTVGASGIRDVQNLINNYIYISATTSITYPIVIQGAGITYSVCRIIGNEIDEDYTALAAARVFYFPYATKYQVDGNYYNGTRRSFGYTNNGVFSFKENILDDGSTPMNSSYCAAATNPWTFFGEGVYMMPVGHRVWKSDPASAASAGWVKEAAPGTAAGDWLTLANNS